MNIIYLEKISFLSLLTIVIRRMQYAELFYFNASRYSDMWIRIFIFLGLLQKEPNLVNFSLAKLINENGESRFIEFVDEIRRICLKVSDDEISKNNFLKRMGKYFDHKKIVFFFQKAISENINEPVFFIYSSRSYTDNIVKDKNNKVILFFEKTFWSRYLKECADKLQVKLEEYQGGMLSTLLPYFVLVQKKINSAIKVFLNDIRYRKLFENRHLTKSLKVRPMGDGPIIATEYMARTITFSEKKRSDFFWAINTDLLINNILLYFSRSDITVTKEQIDTLNKKGMKAYSLSKEASQKTNTPAWYPGSTCKRLRILFAWRVTKEYIVSFLRMEYVPLFYVIEMFWLIFKYAYWYDFFRTNNIKIHITPHIFSKNHIVQSMALEKCKGVSTAYQFYNSWFSSMTFGACVDCMFIFSPEYKWVWKKNRSLINTYVSCGYITDYAFKEVRQDSLLLRKQMLDKGAKFIICFFDENSSNRRMDMIPNENTEKIYKNFFEKILQDETLGLVCKPGYPRTLQKRISGIGDLLERAKASGRCVFLDNGTYVTEKYPAEAAQAADICVGLLLSGTVALESYLAGIPTVFLDLERLYFNEVYQWGKGRVVFDNLEELFVALESFRNNKNSIPGFGDLSRWANDKDPFKDGNASLRIGRYISWLFEKLKDGAGRDGALMYANQKYAEIWKEANITSSSYNHS